MSDTEEDIIFYTPLKRLKTNCDSSFRSEALRSKGKGISKSQANSVSCSQPVKGNKKFTKLSLSKSSNYSTPKIQKISQFSSQKNSSSFKHPNHLYHHILPPNSNEKSGLSNSHNERISAKLSFNRTDQMDDTDIFDEDVPDIDLTEIESASINSTSTELDTNPAPIFRKPDLTLNCKSSELESAHKSPEKILDSMSSGSSEGERTILFNVDEGCHLNNRENNLKRNENVNKNQNDCKITYNYNDDHNDDDFVYPVKDKLEKVDSWLNNSLQYLVPHEAKVNQRTETEKATSSKNLDVDTDTVTSMSSRIILDNENKEIPSSTTVCESLNGSPEKLKTTETTKQACIHLHFHLHTPKKFVQPTIEHFFGQSSQSNSTTSSRCSPKTTGPNGERVIEAWKTIMNSMRKSEKNPVEQKKQNENPVNRSLNMNGYSSGVRSGKGTRLCPFYKLIEGTNFAVDAFSYGYINSVTSYFLSHFHADHYRGLHKKFSKIIYCSQITANLVRLKIGVGNQYLRPLLLDEPRVIDGVEVTFYDANHCPGAVMIVFRLPSGKTYLHVGDFRAHSRMETISTFQRYSIDILYLDTTYLDPMYNFPSQEYILEKCVKIVRKHKNISNKTLFLVGSYTIGKEKVFKAVANELNCKIYASMTKQNVLRCLIDKQITDKLTSSKFEAQVHVVPMAEISLGKLKNYIEKMHPQFDSLVALRPTGWEHSSSNDAAELRPNRYGNVYIYGIPYSEHSSYSELQRFVQFTQPKKIVPTVNNGSPVRRNKMDAILTKWQEKT